MKYKRCIQHSNYTWNKDRIYEIKLAYESSKWQKDNLVYKRTVRDRATQLAHSKSKPHEYPNYFEQTKTQSPLENHKRINDAKLQTGDIQTTVLMLENILGIGIKERRTCDLKQEKVRLKQL